MQFHPLYPISLSFQEDQLKCDLDSVNVNDTKMRNLKYGFRVLIGGKVMYIFKTEKKTITAQGRRLRCLRFLRFVLFLGRMTTTAITIFSHKNPTILGYLPNARSIRTTRGCDNNILRVKQNILAGDRYNGHSRVANKKLTSSPSWCNLPQVLNHVKPV